jgi:hypothetical protein
MSSDSPGDPYQKEHKLVDKCIEKQQVHPDVVQLEIIAGSYRPLIFLFIDCCNIFCLLTTFLCKFAPLNEKRPDVKPRKTFAKNL